ncbi:polyprenol reductase-like [Cyprinus carpio]|uniref:Polyprenol reductase-like n=1 Tax=Cyprinus carpio TaxID=7962 RepID=A0A9R0BFD7_CYPCA|nr:polyprenol reductase-like [Cyprinus carpio]
MQKCFFLGFIWHILPDHEAEVSSSKLMCFYHFYAVSVIWNGLLLLFSLRCVVMNEALPDWLIDVLWCLTGRPRAAWKVPGSLFNQLTWHQVMGTLLFIWAALLQNRSLSLLAKMSTDSSGRKLLDFPSEKKFKLILLITVYYN